MSEIVNFEIKEGVGFITLNRADKYNAVTEELAKALQEVLDRCQEKDVRAVYITGAGKAFCAGQDLEEVMREGGHPIDHIVEYHWNPIVKKIRELEKPVVAAVNGIAAGAGANLALCCDIVVASDKASFMQAFSKIGLIPDTGGTWTLPRLVGVGKAVPLMMLADQVSAEEAERMNMIYQVFTADEFVEKSEAIAYRLAKMPTKGLGFIKRAINRTFENSLENQCAIEKQIQAVAFATRDSQEGIAAFREKREANFTGE